MRRLVRPLLASRFEGRRSVNIAALRERGGKKMATGNWTFPDGSTLILTGRTWRALAPVPKMK